MTRGDTDLLARLRDALGSSYRIERELGGGGMSRVFLAEEVALGRRVVVKVLPPEMAAGVNQERFRREIQLAAKLQHPHVVPLLSAGSKDDLLWYVMPYIDGESLRAKLAREGELPVGEALRVLRDVLDALGYAHSHHVVHRDIKPDNVLLSGKHALVTDFGVAKAVAESTGKQGITSMGVALGTPLYMAPEQATADPHVDHRADLYAVGVLAYEMLCGQPPFTGPSAQAVLAAHLADPPVPVTDHRTAVPDALNALVLRCLEKKAADRWQRAEELLPHLEAMLTPTGGVTPTGTQPVAAASAARAAEAAAGAHPVRVAGLFGLASVGVLAIVYGAVRLIGLPDWVSWGAIALLAIGLPVMLVTGHHERRRALARSRQGHPGPSPTGAAALLTWRKALVGGGVAFAGLGAVSAGYMAMRALGIGPVGTLLARGELGAQERILVADVANATPDSGLGETVTDLLRIALTQSRVITVMERSQVAEVLERMRLDRTVRLTPELAAEVAAREGIKAFVAGEVRPLGDDYVVSARVVSAQTGDALVAVSQAASGSGGLIHAVDRVAARLRERIGESLRTLRAEPPLDQVTTSSLDALRLYAQADRYADQGDLDRAVALLQQAVGRDTAFAMGYRRLAALLLNEAALAGRAADGRAALTRAYALRDRLSERERYQVEGLYADGVEQDFERAATAYLALLERYPNDGMALNNLGRVYSFLGRRAETEAVYRRAIDAGVAAAVTYTNHLFGLLLEPNLAAADSILARFAERFPGSAEVGQWTSNVAAARRDWAGASQAAARLLEAQPAMRAFAHNRLAAIAQVHGRLGEAARQADDAVRATAQRAGLAPAERDLLMALHRAERAAWFGSQPERVGAELERLWRQNQVLVASRDPIARRYPVFVPALAVARRPTMARRLLEDFRSSLSQGAQAQYAPLLYFLEADVLVAEGRPLDAVPLYQRVRKEFCPGCVLTRLGQAFDRAGVSDSALAYYRRYVETPPVRLGPSGIAALEDEVWLGPTYRRLGELSEQGGDRGKALDYYGRFAELWKDADPELQPLVRDVRQRMVTLAAEAGGR